MLFFFLFFLSFYLLNLCLIVLHIVIYFILFDYRIVIVLWQIKNVISTIIVDFILSTEMQILYLWVITKDTITIRFFELFLQFNFFQYLPLSFFSKSKFFSFLFNDSKHIFFVLQFLFIILITTNLWDFKWRFFHFKELISIESTNSYIFC